MGVREDVVSSAVKFLQDPSVAASPMDKRVAFLQSKNLTQEEIDVALARAGDSNYAYQPQQQQVARQGAAPSYGYGAPPYQAAYWNQAPPEPPRRDWRDYFIMATVMGGLGYGIYALSKRYIVPLIAPPTPPQLEQDKASIDESFKRAFELIEQLSADTAQIKSSEEARKERLDAALAEVESTITELKQASRRRDDDTRRIGDDVRNLQSMIPRAIDAQTKETDNRLKDLNTELKSLKTLISNRMTGSAPAPSATRPNGIPAASSGPTNGYTPATAAEAPPATASTPAPAPEQPKPASNPLSNRFGSGKGGIPAWQLNAKQADDKPSGIASSGTVTSASDGQ